MAADRDNVNKTDAADAVESRRRAPVAQWIEQPPPKGQVARSIRVRGANVSGAPSYMDQSSGGGGGGGGGGGSVPVPLRGTSCIDPWFPESSFTVTDPVTVLVSTGVNEMETAQCDPGARTEGQLSVSENPALAETLNPFN